MPDVGVLSVADLVCGAEYAGVEMYDHNSQRANWPGAAHRLHFVRAYLCERLRVYRARAGAAEGGEKGKGAQSSRSELMEACEKMVGDAEAFGQICAGMDVSCTLCCCAVELSYTIRALVDDCVQVRHGCSSDVGGVGPDPGLYVQH